MRPRHAALLVLALLGLAAAPNREQLREAERARAAELQAERAAEARAAAAEAEERRLARQRVAAAARLRDAEQAVEATAAQVQTLARRQQEAEEDLAARAADMAPMLPLAERLSLYPAETLLAVPLPPEQAVRGVLVLAGVARQLESEATSLRAEQSQEAALQRELAEAAPKLSAAQATRALQAMQLDSQIGEARAVQQAAEDAAADAAQGAAAEAARANGLRAAIAMIEAGRRSAQALAKQEEAAASHDRRGEAAASARRREEALARPSGPGLSAPRGQLTTPVAGAVVRSFGEAIDGGVTTGIFFRAAPAARVVSPCGGRAVFAGPFRSFGLLLIVDCGGGYHFVLAGFERLDARVGQTLQPGEPVGVMAASDPRSGAASGAGRPTLYLELRRDGAPVNPAPFLRGLG